MIRASTRSTRGLSNATGFRLGIGLGPQIHHDRLATVQAFEPLAAPAERFQLARQAGLKVGVKRGAVRLLMLPISAGPPPLLTEPAGDLAALVRAEELVDPARTEAG